MKYIHENARLSVIRNYKIIPETKLQEAENTGLSILYELLKEYRYTKILSLKDTEYNLFKFFEESVIFELQETLFLLEKFLHLEDKWIIQLFKFFYIENILQVNNEKDLNFDIMRIEQFKKFLPKIVKTKNENIKKLLKLLIDFENIKMFLSYKTIAEIENIDNLQFFAGGNISEQFFAKIFPDAELFKKEVNKKYPSLDLENIGSFYYSIEAEIKDNFFQYKNYYFTIEPLIIYFFEKLFEVQRVKSIFLKFVN